MTARYNPAPSISPHSDGRAFHRRGADRRSHRVAPAQVRGTRSLIFMSAELSVDDRCVSLANGVFKIMRR